MLFRSVSLLHLLLECIKGFDVLHVCGDAISGQFRGGLIHASKLEAAERTLKRSQSLYDSLYQNYVEHLMTEHEYVTLKARYKAETEDTERMIAVLEQEQRESKVYTSENRFLTEFRSFMGTDKLTKEMATALVERIYVDADKNIDIRLRYRDEYMALLKFIEGRTVV